MGEDIERDQEILFSFYRIVEEDYSPEDLIFDHELIECADPDVILT